MIRYSIFLLVINTYGRGLGNPVDTLNSHFESLANTCRASPLLAKEIKQQQDNCKVVIGEPIERRVQCLLFYDINKQLCSAVDSTKLTIAEDSYKAQMSQTLDVTAICNSAKSWELKNYSEFPEYQPDVLKKPAACLRVCSGQDLESVDVNFYCKYFNWGYELLKTPPKVMLGADHNGSTSFHTENNISNVDSTAMSPGTQQASKGEKTQDASIPAVENAPPSAKSVKSISEPGTHEDNNLKDATGLKLASGSEQSTQVKLKKFDTEDTPKTEGEKPAVVPTAVEGNKEVPVEEEPPKKDEEAKKPSGSGPADAVAPLVGDTKPEAAAPANEESLDDADDVDSDEGKENLLDLNGDDGDDPDVSDFAKPYEGKITQKKTITGISSANSDAAEREMFQSMDAYADADDNFFPFFLTCVIVVVVLYVLYHNKNKVTKVVLGLIVEGRQPGRRRNSRGHAYRRLDTLEQAMSTTTATAPSRIIY